MVVSVVEALSIRIQKGSLYLPHSLYQHYFDGLQSVILLLRESSLYILPVRHPGGGGLLMKIRNARGDRVVHADEFFRDHALDEKFSDNQQYPVHWDNDNAALVVHF